MDEKYNYKDVEIKCPKCGWKLPSEYGRVPVHGNSLGVCIGSGMTIEEAEKENTEKHADN